LSNLKASSGYLLQNESIHSLAFIAKSKDLLFADILTHLGKLSLREASQKTSFFSK
jgi:hypothetical protein